MVRSFVLVKQAARTGIQRYPLRTRNKKMYSWQVQSAGKSWESGAEKGGRVTGEIVLQTAHRRWMTIVSLLCMPRGCWKLAKPVISIGYLRSGNADPIGLNHCLSKQKTSYTLRRDQVQYVPTRDYRFRTCRRYLADRFPRITFDVLASNATWPNTGPRPPFTLDESVYVY